MFTEEDYKKEIQKKFPPYLCVLSGCRHKYTTLEGFKMHFKNIHNIEMDKQRRFRIDPSRISRARMTHEEAQRIVEFDFDGKINRVSIYEELPFEMKGQKKPISFYPSVQREVEEFCGELYKFDSLKNLHYDIDEQDLAWLEIMNKKFKMSENEFKHIMEWLEKEAFKKQKGFVGSDVNDALCSVCLDGTSVSPNSIVFCDHCNLSVHQDCYGIPNIPEGPWICNHCLELPSTPLSCCLCPNTHGALKKCSNGQKWAHIICALFIPRITFGSLAMMEPIEGVDNLLMDQRRLVCCVCKGKDVGVCIQCCKNLCFRAFHVTCAQSSNFTLEMSISIKSSVKMIAFCDKHSSIRSNEESSPTKRTFNRRVSCNNNNVQTPPQLTIPQISPKKIDLMKSCLPSRHSDELYSRIYSYWTLKRLCRSGMPLIRRIVLLENDLKFDDLYKTPIKNIPTQKNDRRTFYPPKVIAECRHNVEKLRMLLELIKRREKLKFELIQNLQKSSNLSLRPLHDFFSTLLAKLKNLDSFYGFFEKPVQLVEYYEYIKQPMDFSTMKKNLDMGKYSNLKSFHADFRLIINNCLTFNEKNTVFYRAALRLRKNSTPIISEAYVNYKVIMANGGFSVNADYLNQLNECRSSFIGNSCKPDCELSGTTLVESTRVTLSDYWGSKS